MKYVYCKVCHKKIVATVTAVLAHISEHPNTEHMTVNDFFCSGE